MKNNYRAKSDIVKVLESDPNELVTKVLWLKFNSSDDLRRLFTPNLANIFFIKNKNEITLNLKNDLFRDFFNDFVENFASKISTDNSNEDIINQFNKAIKDLVNIGQKEKKLPMNLARGLFGELLYLKELLMESSNNEVILDGWHRPAPANNDFDFRDKAIEIKTLSRSKTSVKISSEFQLELKEDKPLLLKCYRIEGINKSKIDSLGELYNEIKILLGPDLINVFAMKCAEDAYCEYLGPDFTLLDYKFTVIEENTYIVDQDNFPRVKREELLPSISSVSYEIDVSAIDEFKL